MKLKIKIKVINTYFAHEDYHLLKKRKYILKKKWNNEFFKILKRYRVVIWIKI